MADNIFQFRQGLVDIQALFFDSKPEPRSLNTYNQLKSDSIVHYGDSDTRDPVYVHLRVKDLYTVRANENTIPLDTKIYIDFLSVPKYLLKRIDDFSDENDLKKVKEKTNHLFTGEINLLPYADKPKLSEKCVKPDTENADSVKGFSDNAEALTVSTINLRQGSKNKHDYYELVFPLNLSDENDKKVYSSHFDTHIIFAWAWVISPNESVKDYQEGFNIDISNLKDRLNFLKNPDGDILKNAYNAIVGLFSKKTYTRDFLDKNSSGGDGFPYDEPSMNFLEVRNTLPFTSFNISSQIGPLGVLAVHPNYFEKYYHHTIIGSINAPYLVDGYTSCKLKLDSDNDFRSDFAQDPSLAIHGFKSQLCEFASRVDNQFYFKKNSASLWLNSLEKKIDGKERISNNNLLKSSDFPFDNGKVELVGHDFIKEYLEEYPKLRRTAGSSVYTGYKEQNTIDLSTFKTIKVADPMELKNKNGKTVIKIQHGLVGNEPFIDSCHTKFNTHLDKTNSDWEAHKYCQRPMIITYNLKRDLKDTEIEEIGKKPIVINFFDSQREPQKSELIPYTLDIDFSGDSGKAGDHAYLIYMYYVESFQFEVFLNTDSCLYADNRKDIHKNYIRNIAFKTEVSPDIVLFKPEEKGLFEGNPIIAIDDFQLSDVKSEKLKKLIKKYQADMQKECGKFLLGFIPKYGDLAGASWEIAVDIASKSKISADKKVELTQKSLITLLTDVLDQEDANNSFITASAGHIGRSMAFALKIIELRKNFEKDTGNLKSPFVLDQQFGESGNLNDSLYLLSTVKLKYEYDHKATIYKPVVKKNKCLTIFSNREVITRESKEPFNVQFGGTAGTLLRDDCDLPNSLTVFRKLYQKKVNEFKNILSPKDESTNEEYLKSLAQNNRLIEICNKVKTNKSMTKFITDNNIGDLFKKRLKNTNNLTDDEIVKLTAFQNLFKYIESSFILCPSCGHIMQASWGWCPYHATAKDLKTWNVTDEYNDGEIKDDFIGSDIGKMTIGEHMQRPYENIKDPKFCRTLVHWTEFLIVN